MKKTLFALPFLLLSLFACQKDEDSSDPFNEPCFTDHFGWITITNLSVNPYDMWLGGDFIGRLSGGKSLKKKIDAGLHDIRVIQVSGYILYPTDISKNFSITSCQEYSFSFP